VRIKADVGSCLIVALALIQIGCSGEHEGREPPRNTAISPQAVAVVMDSSESVDVSEHFVGTLPLDSPLAFVASRFPQFDTSTGHIEETPVPTWTFHINSVSASAMQWLPSIDASRPAEGWLISGVAIRVGGKELPITWGDLHALFPGEAHLHIDELGAHVELCELPGITVFLDFIYSGDAMDTMTAASIPHGARVGDLAVYPGSNKEPCERTAT
jgi:hypothetical protein